MTCKECHNCIYLGMCVYFKNRLDPTICTFFKPKSRFVELPCEVGQTVYDITEFICKAPSPEMYELKANEMTVEQGAEGGLNFVYDGMYINCEDIGETVFLSREEAEKALAERSK